MEGAGRVSAGAAYGAGTAPLRLERCEAQGGGFDAGCAKAHRLFVSLGSVGIVCDEAAGARRHALRANSVVVVPAGCRARWTLEARAVFSVLLLDAGFLAAVARDTFGDVQAWSPSRIVVRAQDPAPAVIATALAQETRSADAGSGLYARSLAAVLAVHLLRSAGAGSEVEHAPRAALRAAAFMREHFSRDIGLQDVADAVHVSAAHLSRVFKRCFGVSPYRYLLQVRVENARALLAAGAARSLADVACAVGFFDQSHLTRHCRRLLGVTPGQLRARPTPRLSAARPAAG